MSQDPRYPISDAPDDVDRLFARLERASVPAELTASVLASTTGRATASARQTWAWPWVLVACVAVGTLAFAGYLLGVSIVEAGGLPLVEALLGDMGLVAVAPGDVIAALGEVIPMELVVVAGISAGALVWAAGQIAAATSRRSYATR